MRDRTLHVMALLGLVALVSSAARADDNQPPAGFTALFNGKDMAGWKADAEGHWKADNGIMTYDGKAKNLASKKAFGDFILLLDWKIPQGGNSGVILRGDSQVEIWDNHNIGSGGIYPQHHKPLKVADKPAGQWNHFEIRVEKGVVTVHLNGQLVLDRFECTFRKPTGPLILQHHGTPLWFKNIYIKELGTPLAVHTKAACNHSPHIPLQSAEHCRRWSVKCDIDVILLVGHQGRATIHSRLP